MLCIWPIFMLFHKHSIGLHLKQDGKLDELFFLSSHIILCSNEYGDSAISRNGISERIQKASPFTLLTKKMKKSWLPRSVELSLSVLFNLCKTAHTLQRLALESEYLKLDVCFCPSGLESPTLTEVIICSSAFVSIIATFSLEWLSCYKTGK